MVSVSVSSCRARHASCDHLINNIILSASHFSLLFYAYRESTDSILIYLYSNFFFDCDYSLELSISFWTKSATGLLSSFELCHKPSGRRVRWWRSRPFQAYICPRLPTHQLLIVTLNVIYLSKILNRIFLRSSH